MGRARWRLRAADRLRAVYRRVVESGGGGYSVSSGEGGLGSTSSPRPLKGFSGPRSGAFKGGGALVCSMPLAMWLMVSKQW